MYQVDVLTPNAPDSADDRPHVHRIDLLDGGVLELGDKHLDLEERLKAGTSPPSASFANCSLYSDRQT